MLLKVRGKQVYQNIISRRSRKLKLLKIMISKEQEKNLKFITNKLQFQAFFLNEDANFFAIESKMTCNLFDGD